jgi:hypothetical protein
MRHHVVIAVVASGLMAMAGRATAGTFAVTSGDWSSAATWSAGVPTNNGNVATTEVAGIGEYAPYARTATVTLSQDSQVNFLHLGDGSGNSGTVDLNGFNLFANYLYLGNGGTGAIQRTGGGTFSVGAHFYVNYGTFTFAPGDAVAEIDLSSFYGTSATTAATGNITGTASVPTSTTLTLGAKLTLSSQLILSGTLNANGYALSAPTVQISYGFSLVNRGPISATTLSVTSQNNTATQTNFDLTAADSVSTFNLYGINTTLPAGASVQTLFLYHNSNGSPGAVSTATTSAVGNVTGSVYIDQGSRLTMGADLNLTGDLNLQGAVSANGHAISANQILIPYYNESTTTLPNRGSITAATLDVNVGPGGGQQAFPLSFGDAVTTFNLRGATSSLPAGVAVQDLNLFSNGYTTYSAASTSAAGNVTNQIEVDPSCVLTLGADLSLTNNLDLRGTLNANGHGISVKTLYMGYNAGPATFQNDGLITATSWQQGNGTQVQLRQPGDVLGSLLLSGNSALTMHDAAGQTTGLTISGQSAPSLSIGAGSDLVLELNHFGLGWILRWANPNGGDHLADLQALINAGKITFISPNGAGFVLTSDSTYSYVTVVAPEPSSLLLLAVAAAWIGGRGIARRRRAVETAS